MNTIVSFLFISLILVIVDSLYISVTKSFYENQVVTIQRVAMSIKPIGAIVCYFFLTLGLWYFVLRPQVSQGKKTEEVVLNAFLLGLVVYGVYASTTYALLKKWRASLATLDTIWGGSLFAIVAWIWKEFVI